MDFTTMQKIDHSVDYQSDGWDDFYDARGSSWRDKDYRYIDRFFLIKTLQGTFADVGCGLGDGLKLFKTSAKGITHFSGCDFAVNTIEKNKTNPDLAGMDFFPHDIMKPIVKQYDNIICLQTLEHLHEPAKAMENLVNATREVLIVATPYKNRRPDENHLWSLDEASFAVNAEIYLDPKEVNIFWVIDKRTNKMRLTKRKILSFKTILKRIK